MELPQPQTECKRPAIAVGPMEAMEEESQGVRHATVWLPPQQKQHVLALTHLGGKQRRREAPYQRAL